MALYRICFLAILLCLLPACAQKKAFSDMAGVTGDMRAPEQQPQERNSLLTLALHVDSAAYPKIREQLNTSGGYIGSFPIEEVINYFPASSSDAPLKRLGSSPFRVHTELGPCLWDQNKALLLISLEADVKGPQSKAANLVIVVDTSKSMEKNGHLELVKDGLLKLTSELKPTDSITILTFSDEPEVILPATRGSQKAAIINTIRHISGGKTVYDETALEKAYDLAQSNYIAHGINRIVLFSDGLSPVKNFRQQSLSAVAGFGRSTNIPLIVCALPQSNTHLLQQIANRGDGTFHYIDSAIEIQKVLQEAAGNSAQLAAKDVKAQIEFNPEQVKNFSVLGYQRRTISHEAFDNEYIDSGDLPAGKRISVIVELELMNTHFNRERRYVYPTPQAKEDTNAPKMKLPRTMLEEYAFFSINWKNPINGNNETTGFPIQIGLLKNKFKDTSNSFQFYTALSAFCLKLQRQPMELSLEAIADIIDKTKGNDPGSYRRELSALCKKAAKIGY